MKTQNHTVWGMSPRGILHKKIADMTIIAVPFIRENTLGFALDLMRKFHPTWRTAETSTRMMPVRDMMGDQ